MVKWYDMSKANHKLGLALYDCMTDWGILFVRGSKFQENLILSRTGALPHRTQQHKAKLETVHLFVNRGDKSHMSNIVLA